MKQKAKKMALYLFLILFICVNLLGCAAPLIIGGAIGVVGGYAASKDTIQGETDKPYDNLWSAALKIGKIRGSITEEDRTKGYIKLEAEASRVYIRLVRLTRATTRLKVSCRKYHMPNLTLAQDIFTKILEEAK